MKQFIFVLFGGIVAVIGGILLVFAGARLAVLIDSKFGGITVSNLANAIIKPVDGTSINGLKRMIMYTTSEDDSVITAATLSLPKAYVDGLSARAYIIKNINTGKVVAPAESDRLLPMASVTKLVTAVVAKKLFKGDEKVIINEAILATYGNTGQFRLGEIFTIDELYYPLLMVSSNDAAEAIARAYNRKEFISAMNEFAQSIGAYRTSFSDPSGLSSNNRSTANDFLTIISWINTNEPEIMNITQLKMKTVRRHTWTNPTRFLNLSNYMGGKNGYTDEAKQTGVALFEMGRNKHLYAVAILASSRRDTDMVTLLSRVRE